MKYDAALLEATSIVVRRLREEKGFSQEELAARAGISRSMIDRTERRERLPSLDVLLKLAPAFKMKASGIVSLIEQELEKKEGD